MKKAAKNLIIIADFLNKFTRRLDEIVTEHHGDLAFLVIDCWYGLEGKQLHTVHEIANETKLSEFEVRKLHNLSLDTLRSLDQRGVIQKLVCSAFAACN